MSKSKKKKRPASKSLPTTNLPETRPYHRAMNTLLNRYGQQDSFGNQGFRPLPERDMERLTAGLDVTLSTNETAGTLYEKLAQKAADILMSKYWPIFQKHTGYPSDREIRNMNFIDVRAWAGPAPSEEDIANENIVEHSINCPLSSDQLDAYIQENFPLGAAPCFEQGVIFAAKDCASVFKLESLDPNTGEMTMFFATYLDDPDQNTLDLTFSCRVKIKPIEEDPYFEVSLLEFKSRNDLIHGTVPRKALNWGPDDFRCWNKIRMEASVKANLAKEAAVATAINFARVNCLLQHHRAKAVPDPDSLETELDQNTEIDLDNPPVRTTELIPGQKPKAKIWTIAGIKIKSATKPQQPKKSTIIRYKAAAWSVSGHLRHYKSGKVIYIKPYQCHRKGLNQNTQPGQRGIVFAGPKPEEEE